MTALADLETSRELGWEGRYGGIRWIGGKEGRRMGRAGTVMQ